jgi:glycosyltransferase involved in cell wall biosynthesis
VLASRSEAFGLTMAVEAGCGMPCVGANIEGIPEVMRGDVTGLLFESGNAEDLLNKLEMQVNLIVA